METMLDKMRNTEAAGLTAKAGGGDGFIKTHVALLNALVTLVPLILLACFKTVGTVLLLSVLVFVLALGVLYVRERFTSRDECRKRERVFRIDEAEMFWRFRYSGSRKGNEEQEKKAS